MGIYVCYLLPIHRQAWHLRSCLFFIFIVKNTSCVRGLLHGADSPVLSVAIAIPVLKMLEVQIINTELSKRFL